SLALWKTLFITGGENGELKFWDASINSVDPLAVLAENLVPVNTLFVYETYLYSGGFDKNWTGFVKRLYGNMFEYSRYFFDYARHNSLEKEISGSVITGCELERLGYKVGKIFAQTYDILCQSHGLATFRDAFTSSSNTTSFSPSEIPEQLQFFTDILCSEFLTSLKENFQFRPLEQLGNFKLKFIDDALMQEHTCVYQTTSRRFIRGIFKNVALGSTGYERAETVVLKLIPLLNDM
ncbi:hypothetical protein MP638_000602, partial [Amoeboaphelidium occidentale]